MEESKTAELNKVLEGIMDSLNDEQKEKVKACKTMDELVQLASREGIELSDEMLDAVAGGTISYENTDDEIFCPICNTFEKVDYRGKTSIHPNGNVMEYYLVHAYQCRKTNDYFYLNEVDNHYYDKDGKMMCSYIAAPEKKKSNTGDC